MKSVQEFVLPVELVERLAWEMKDPADLVVFSGVCQDWRNQATRLQFTQRWMARYANDQAKILSSNPDLLGLLRDGLVLSGLMPTFSRYLVMSSLEVVNRSLFRIKEMSPPNWLDDIEKMGLAWTDFIRERFGYTILRHLFVLADSRDPPLTRTIKFLIRGMPNDAGLRVCLPYTAVRYLETYEGRSKSYLQLTKMLARNTLLDAATTNGRIDLLHSAKVTQCELMNVVPKAVRARQFGVLRWLSANYDFCSFTVNRALLKAFTHVSTGKLLRIFDWLRVCPYAVVGAYHLWTDGADSDDEIKYREVTEVCGRWLRAQHVVWSGEEMEGELLGYLLDEE